jgi:hypothetical protein
MPAPERSLEIAGAPADELVVPAGELVALPVESVVVPDELVVLVDELVAVDTASWAETDCDSTEKRNVAIARSPV